MKKIIHSLLILSIFLHPCLVFSNNEKLLVISPLADIRGIPEGPNPNLKQPILSKDNPWQLSQALFSEFLLKEEDKNDDWLRVKDIEQLICLDEKKGLEPLVGFIKTDQTCPVQHFPHINLVVKSQWAHIFSKPDTTEKIIMSVCIGTKLHGEKLNDNWYNIIFPEELTHYLDLENNNAYMQSNDVLCITPTIEKTEEELRLNIIRTALSLLENPYCWGGRSFYNQEIQEIATGSDCSGFTNLVYRATGLEIPKNSRSQFYVSNKIDGNQVKSGDLIFFAPPDKPKNINHVMLYIGNGNIIENTGTKGICKTRIVSDKKRLSNNIENIKNGEQGGEFIVYFGTYLGTKEKMQEARNRALNIKYLS